MEGGGFGGAGTIGDDAEGAAAVAVLETLLADDGDSEEAGEKRDCDAT